jgi:hypothetical protein
MKIVPVDSQAVYAVLNQTAAANQYVLRLDDFVWREHGVVTPVNGPFFGFDTVRDPSSWLYLSTFGRSV